MCDGSKGSGRMPINALIMAELQDITHHVNLLSNVFDCIVYRTVVFLSK